MTLTPDDGGAVSDNFSVALEGGLSTSLAVGFGAVLVIEGVVLHLWIADRSALWAWVVTATNVATLVWLWREARAASRSAMTVTARDVEVAVGNRLRLRFARKSIASAEVATWRSAPDPAAARDYINTAKPLEPNVLLVLREPAEARLTLGIVKRVSRIGLRVHDAERVVQGLDRALFRDDRDSSPVGSE